MTRTVKWILGILIGLVSLCAVVVLGLFAISRLGFGAVAVSRRGFTPFDGRGPMPMAPYQEMPYRHFGAFSPFGFLGGGLILAALLGLFVLGVIALVLLLRRPARAAIQSTVPIQSAAVDPAATGAPMTSDRPAAQDQSTPSQVIPPSAPTGQSCPSCGRSVQADWSHCPYCGTGLSSSG
ncbi:MAG: zinc ribbon domain-containing protein [Anaerolineales bacterium]|jgi:uncharacterized membrane protein